MSISFESEISEFAVSMEMEITDYENDAGFVIVDWKSTDRYYIDLRSLLQPPKVMDIYESTIVTRFTEKVVTEWYEPKMNVFMTFSQEEGMPEFSVELQEFKACEKSLKRIHHYKDRATVTISPALGMEHIKFEGAQQYIDDIVSQCLHVFAKVCWDGDDDFAPRLFELMISVKLDGREGKLIDDGYRLVVATFIISHSATMVASKKKDTLEKLTVTYPEWFSDKFTSPRLANRQIKKRFAEIREDILSTFLEGVNRLFNTSEGHESWVAAFISMICLCMAQEDMQRTIYQITETMIQEKEIDEQSGLKGADEMHHEIDVRTDHIMSLFRTKYIHEIYLFKNQEQNCEAKFGNETAVLFMQGVVEFVQNNSKYSPSAPRDSRILDSSCNYVLL